MLSAKKIKNKTLFLSRFIARILAVTIFCVIFGLATTNQASAAGLYLRASSSQVKVDSLLTVNLTVDTQGKFINNAEATIQFSNDLVEVVSLDYRSSIFSLWVEQPNFSNNSGRISFNGGIPDPGYKGSGKILSIVFKAKKAGTASFLFSGAAVRENDGLGTDILSGQSSASITILANVVEEPVVEKPVVEKPVVEKPTEKPKDPPVKVEPPVVSEPAGSTLVVVSPTYPDSNIWYALREGTISLKVPTGATAIQTLLDRQPNSVPTVKYNSAVYSKNISDLDDGVWYFHARYLKDNTWSKITHYRIQIDATGPRDLNIIEEKTKNCVVGLRLQAIDDTSGVDYYIVKIDDQTEIKVLAQEAQNIIPWPQTSSGQYQVTVVAFDKAGNTTEAATQVNIEALTPPTIDSLPAQVSLGDVLVVTGRTSYANSLLKLFIAHESGDESSYDVMTDHEGVFTYTSEALNKKGSYTVSASIFGCNNISSALSIKSTFSVEKISRVKDGGNQEPVNLYLIAAIIFSLLTLVLIGWYKYFKLGRRLRAKKQASDNLVASLLLEKANKNILVLERAKKGQRLTPNEELAIANLKETLAHIKSLTK